MNADRGTLTATVGEDGVAEIVLCRPELLNRFDQALHHDLTETLRGMRTDRSVRAVVLASTGKAFSAGGDFALMREAHQDALIRQSVIDDARGLLDAFLQLPQPIVAAVQGAAMGLGATVVLACDAVVAARSASLADTHVNVGLTAGDGGCLVWPASAGILRARRHLLTGDPLDAETAFQLGMVTDLVDDPAEVPTVARAIAARIAALPPQAVQCTKRVLNTLSRQRAGEVIDLSLAYEAQTMTTADHIEGIDAFLERRPARYTGR